ncbi:MAG: hypothetical protein GY751_16485 [Bacteroidetes bacterium]|nr:hypothetical protein [Bacteroidota bacterium]
MITKLFFSSILTFLISSGLFITNDQSSADPASNQTTEEVNVVKAILHNGEVLPLIELPVVEITGNLNTDLMMDATVFNDEVLPMIELPEVVITPNS